MKKTFFLLLLLTALVGCRKTKQLSDNLNFNSIMSNSDRITIKLYDSTETEIVFNEMESSKPLKTFNITDENSISRFRDLFDNAKQTEYCCCPKVNYSISFFKAKRELGIYYVDTIEYQNKVRIFEQSYQYSFLINKKDWKSYLYKLLSMKRQKRI